MKITKNLNLPKSFKLGFAIICLCYGLCLILALLAERSNLIPFKILALILIAGLQNHLQILQHEGAHFHLHPSRRVNDFFVDVFCSLPFLGSLKHYRYFHLQHHKYLLFPDKDPEIEFYREQGYEFKERPLGQRIKSSLLDLIGWNYLRFTLSFHYYLKTEGKKESRLALSKEENRRRVGVYLFLFAVFCFFREKFLFYWFLPQATFLFFFLKIQGYGEHLARTDKIETCTLSQPVNWVKAFFIYPLHSNLHLAHHLAPRKKWYELKDRVKMA